MFQLKQQFWGRLCLVAAACMVQLSGCTPVKQTGNATGAPSTNTRDKVDTMADEQYLALNKLLVSGTDFLGTGNEPFWSLHLNLEQTMKFTLAGGDSITTPIVKPLLSNNGKEIRYQANVESGSLAVVLFKEPCINSMSGDTVSHKVVVRFKDREYEGCGRYLSDYRLHDLWVLETIGGSKPQTAKLKRGLPTLEFNLTKGEVMGHTGCNGIGGPLEITGRFLSMPRLMGTKMACNDDGFERDYFALLSVPQMPYAVEQGKLVIRSGNTELVYRKVD